MTRGEPGRSAGWLRTRAVYRQPGDVRCPSCGGLFEPRELRLRRGATRGLAICSICYRLEGPDGGLEPAR